MEKIRGTLTLPIEVDQEVWKRTYDIDDVRKDVGNRLTGNSDGVVEHLTGVFASDSGASVTAFELTWENIDTSPKPDVYTDEEVYEGMLARVRPYYHVPASPSSLTPARSPWTWEVEVIARVGEMWTVKHTWETDSAPWPRRQSFYAKELHKAYKQCACTACTWNGGGIHELRGA